MDRLVALLMLAVAVAEAPVPRPSLPASAIPLETYVKNQLELFNCEELIPAPDTPTRSACNGAKVPDIKYPDTERDVLALLCMAYVDMATRWCFRSDLNNSRRALEAVAATPTFEPICPLSREALPFNSTDPETHVSVLYDYLSNKTHCARICTDFKDHPIEPCLTVVRGNLHMASVPAPPVISAEQRRVNAKAEARAKKNRSKNITNAPDVPKASKAPDAPPPPRKVRIRILFIMCVFRRFQLHIKKHILPNRKTEETASVQSNSVLFL